MNKRSRFFTKKFEFLTLAQALEISSSHLIQEVSQSEKIYDVSTLEKADATQISFLNSAAYFEKFKNSSAGFCLIDEASARKALQLGLNHIIFLICKNPYFAYAKIVDAFYSENKTEFYQQQTIHPSAKIGQGTQIAPLAYVGKNVEIGKNCFIAPTACVMDGCIIGDNTIINAGAVVSFAQIGNNCIIYNGAKIGQDGFGFAHDAGINHKIIQIGIVEIGSDVEIGANSCIDRGAIENTKIADGVKIDNLVQIGHNVEIGQGTVIAGCSAIAGSTKVGRFVQIGGGCAINGHIEIGDACRIAGMSGVMRDLPAKSIVGGAPALPIRDWHRMNAKLIELSKGKI